MVYPANPVERRRQRLVEDLLRAGVPRLDAEDRADALLTQMREEEIRDCLRQLTEEYSLGF